jgi:hemin uptake protein HemP
MRDELNAMNVDQESVRPTADQATAAPARSAVRLVNASTLFGSAREIVIVHNAREYRLRITAQQKLILTA